MNMKMATAMNKKMKINVKRITERGPIEGDELMQSLDDFGCEQEDVQDQRCEGIVTNMNSEMSIPILIHHSNQPVIYITIQIEMDIR